MGHPGTPYKIKDGDTLWDLAAEHLGDPREWPRIYAFNNQPDIIKAGARRIDDPDLIYAGATLHLPIAPGLPKKPPMPNAIRKPQPGNLKDQLPHIRMPVKFAYEMKGDPVVMDYGTFVARIYMHGRVIVTLGKTLPVTLVSNGNVEMVGKTETDGVFAKLISENKVSFNPQTREIKFQNKMTTAAKNLHGPVTSIGVELSSRTGMPVLKGEMHLPELQGHLGADQFVTGKIKLVIEIEPRVPPPGPVPAPVLVPQGAPNPLPSPVRRPVAEPGVDWGQVAKDASTAALITAGIVVTAYGISLFFSGGTSSAGAPAVASLVGVILVGGAATQVEVH